MRYGWRKVWLYYSFDNEIRNSHDANWNLSLNFCANLKKTKNCTVLSLFCTAFLFSALYILKTDPSQSELRIFFMYIVHFCFFLYISTIQLRNSYGNLGELEVMWKISPFGLVFWLIFSRSSELLRCFYNKQYGKCFLFS